MRELSGKNKTRGVQVTGSLNLVDLAGSERLARSQVRHPCARSKYRVMSFVQAEGVRLKETQAINKSLSCLADVFNALAKKAPHVPFRNSKLT